MNKIGVVNKYNFLIGILLILNSRFFYLINVDSFPINYTDITLLCALLFIFYVILKFRSIQVYYRYRIFILAIIPLLISSAYMATIHYNQPFLMGILPQRGWLVWMFAYFPLVKLFRSKHISVDSIIALMYKIAIVYLTVVSIQYLFPQLSLLYVNKNMRYGEIRLYVGDSPIILLAGHALYKVFREHSIKHGLFFGWCIILESMIMKGRAGTMTMLVTALICALIEKSNINRKLFHFCLVGIAILLFCQTDMAQQLILSIQGKASMETDYVREAGRALYLELLSEDWRTILFGCGYANSNWGQAVFIIMGSGRYAQEGLSILTADNGMYGFALYYGVIGIIWALGLYAYCLKHAWRIYRYSGNFMFLFFLIWDLMGVQTLYLDCTYALLEFPLFLAIMEIMYDKMLLNKMNDEVGESYDTV